MPTFKITTSTPSVVFDYYKVEASTEEEAIECIMNGEAEAYDSKVETFICVATYESSGYDVNELEIVDVTTKK